MTNPDREELLGYADSLNQQAGWIEAALAPETPDSQRIGIEDIDIDELRGASDLLRRLASSDSGVKGEPVAWRYRHVNYVDWSYAKTKHPRENLEQEPLFTAPPADAGMREALEVARTFVAGVYDSSPKVRIARDKALATIDAALTAPGATTKSDGGQPIHAIKMPEYPYQELDMSGDHYGVTSNYSDYTPVTVRGSTSDPSSTRSEVTVESLADWLNKRGSLIAKAALSNPGRHSTIDLARALLDQFEIGRK